ncbi:cytochrome C [Geomonas sp. RF6]|uniref:cytochrome C n=1 Tax=Geomonas sp. RF6 TaxID=2897342 RepID=UPI001E4778F5|nr:cytochrome C [Geomonas sp. RF6]UFS71545.1 cytochrome C [Geomonas sp. RF6]
MKPGRIPSVALALALATPLWGSQETPISGKNLGSVTGGDFKIALSVIEKKCTVCHSSSVINSALKSEKDMLAIQKSMEKKGAKLTTNEREVLGIYWKQHPLKEKRQ